MNRIDSIIKTDILVILPCFIFTILSVFLISVTSQIKIKQWNKRKKELQFIKYWIKKKQNNNYFYFYYYSYFLKRYYLAHCIIYVQCCFILIKSAIVSRISICSVLIEEIEYFMNSKTYITTLNRYYTLLFSKKNLEKLKINIISYQILDEQKYHLEVIIHINLSKIIFE
jgi:hypothetical protein